MPSGFISVSNSGCLLPLLIIFNLFFGRMFFSSTGWWLGVELLLILIFILRVRFMLKSIHAMFDTQSRQGDLRRPAGKVIDIQAQEVKDKQELE